MEEEWVESLFFGLYVGVSVLEFPQACKINELCLVAATFFSICFGVR
jgi:hypothetical protein